MNLLAEVLFYVLMFFVLLIPVGFILLLWLELRNITKRNTMWTCIIFVCLIFGIQYLVESRDAYLSNLHAERKMSAMFEQVDKRGNSFIVRLKKELRRAHIKYKDV